ncbi:MAG: tRNA uridine-5-carboxymethylaminomethyl(34) synthesis GTPase MnmE [candidate division Zixibacteria bacterium]|nr:tRNA uridine-5-carboxymethylaminomethyl(34) synthesis GTPase MnmE [candidate division Zixibacteria bacterium]
MNSITSKPSIPAKQFPHEKKNFKAGSDTIAAISTPPGEGGIGIVRLSGNNSFKIADKLFAGKTPPSQMKTHTVCFGKLMDATSNELLDEVLVTVLRSPNSYTCEDMVEISCHGGSLVLSRILEQTLRCGARLANPGEFTLRAFLNGRIDLAQAEAVVDIIRAKTDSSLRIALQNLEGKLSKELNDCREKLIDILAEIELGIDFIEEDVEELDRKKIIGKITELETDRKNLLDSYVEGRILKEGLNVVIVGSPNVGKSSLLNALLGKDRAIVTPIPGTTRDTIEEFINIKGIPVRLVDTAGFHISKNKIELEGIRRAKVEIDKADLVIWVVDLSKKLSENEIRLEKLISKYKYVVVLNKIDIASNRAAKEMQREFKKRDVISVSALQSIGIKELKDFIISSFVVKNKSESSLIISNLRHKQLLEKSLDNLKRAKEGLVKEISPEFIALDLRVALDSIGEIVGKVVTDDILNRIFSKFCVGK